MQSQTRSPSINEILPYFRSTPNEKKPLSLQHELAQAYCDVDYLIKRQHGSQFSSPNQSCTEQVATA